MPQHGAQHLLRRRVFLPPRRTLAASAGLAAGARGATVLEEALRGGKHRTGLWRSYVSLAAQG